MWVPHEPVADLTEELICEKWIDSCEFQSYFAFLIALNKSREQLKSSRLSAANLLRTLSDTISPCMTWQLLGYNASGIVLWLEEFRICTEKYMDVLVS